MPMVSMQTRAADASKLQQQGAIDGLAVAWQPSSTAANQQGVGRLVCKHRHGQWRLDLEVRTPIVSKRTLVG